MFLTGLKNDLVTLVVYKFIFFFNIFLPQITTNINTLSDINKMTNDTAWTDINVGHHEGFKRRINYYKTKKKKTNKNYYKTGLTSCKKKKQNHLLKENSRKKKKRNLNTYSGRFAMKRV